MLKLKFQRFGQLTWRINSLEKTLMLKKIEGRRRGWQRMRRLDGISYLMTWVWASSGSCDGQGGLVCCNSWDCKESGMTERLNWTELNLKIVLNYGRKYWKERSANSGQSQSRDQIFETPWTAARQASLSSPTPRAFLNSCPLSQWFHPTISTSVIPFSSHL